MPVPVLHELRQRLPGAQFYNCYGQSEIGPLATVLGPDEHDARPASAGRPILNVQTRVVDPETMEDVPPGEQGEIVHRSPQLLVGYWDKPEETEQAFRGGWFHSGDVATIDEDGYLCIVDRIKDVINTGGVVVSSREVEEALFTHPAVSEVAVVGLPDERWIEAITAFVVLKEGEEATAEALTAHAKVHLAGFKVPKRVRLHRRLAPQHGRQAPEARAARPLRVSAPASTSIGAFPRGTRGRRGEPGFTSLGQRLRTTGGSRSRSATRVSGAPASASNA